jgi:hypothetical protein
LKSDLSFKSVARVNSELLLEINGQSGKAGAYPQNRRADRAPERSKNISHISH